MNKLNNMSDMAQLQQKILETMLFIDQICRANNIVYYIMGGTALGAVRHKGFIPWDDDLDIFMTIENYNKFEAAFMKLQSEDYTLQEWRTVPEYLEYAKVRKNGTTFIERAYKNRPDMHHGIYVDIMILHKCPRSRWKQRLLYWQSKFVTFYALSQRNWRPSSATQKGLLRLLRVLPAKTIAKHCYKRIYHYDTMTQNYDWCYFITPANFRQGVFAADLFGEPKEIPFEQATLYGPSNIESYLSLRYGDYMKLPPLEQRQAAVHAEVYDVSAGYASYFNLKQTDAVFKEVK